MAITIEKILKQIYVADHAFGMWCKAANGVHNFAVLPDGMQKIKAANLFWEAYIGAVNALYNSLVTYFGDNACTSYLYELALNKRKDILAVIQHFVTICERRDAGQDGNIVGCRRQNCLRR